MSSIVIYTDLDGSLLDHHSYSHAAADALLAELETQGIPVIPVSSKTRAELLQLRRQLDNRHPFIVDVNRRAGFCGKVHSFRPALAVVVERNAGYQIKYSLLAV
jgi:hydroxymethylpyrimidine pyrophosphatase-like HAD family hydrolase